MTIESKRYETNDVHNVRENSQLAAKLAEYGELLAGQDANHFRVAAYRRASHTIAQMQESLVGIFESQGVAGLVALPTIGEGIASAIIEMLQTGRWRKLERLRGELDHEQLFATVPGIGHEFAKRIHDTLHIDTLEALEAAAYDGSLERVPGLGPRRLAGIRASLAVMLGRVDGWRRPETAHPTVGLLLDIDRKYRELAREGKLPLIAPKRFNLSGKAWLPIYHLTHEKLHFTVLFSNTARAHELNRTHDWVRIYYNDTAHREGQVTIVTEMSGSLRGRRVVRGRETECQAYYKRQSEKARNADRGLSQRKPG